MQIYGLFCNRKYAKYAKAAVIDAQFINKNRAKKRCHHKNHKCNEYLQSYAFIVRYGLQSAMAKKVQANSMVSQSEHSNFCNKFILYESLTNAFVDFYFQPNKFRIEFFCCLYSSADEPYVCCLWHLYASKCQSVDERKLQKKNVASDIWWRRPYLLVALTTKKKEKNCSTKNRKRRKKNIKWNKRNRFCWHIAFAWYRWYMVEKCIESEWWVVIVVVDIVFYIHCHHKIFLCATHWFHLCSHSRTNLCRFRKLQLILSGEGKLRTNSQLGAFSVVHRWLHEVNE